MLSRLLYTRFSHKAHSVKRWYETCRLNNGVSLWYIEVGDLWRTTSYNEQVLTEKISSYYLSEYVAEAMYDFQHFYSDICQIGSHVG